MVTKLAGLGAMGGHHTAGIFSDMTVDGPEIGTLVVIIDRAKNLPNRRTMGKQDPYCAARLGKEAKKTNTDKRGGQTPKWDQELRFTVHDSADYHNLKVSVFNDDKKTELIGETWVSLEEVLTPGGGQSDTWHGLNCRGKYAGEIRIELTYYDTRPKAEKPAPEKKQAARVDAPNASVGGPREASPVKRRPLPQDPTGASPAGTPESRPLPAPASGPRSYPTPPRQQRPNEHTPTHQRRSQHLDAQPHRRPLPDASPLNGSHSSQHTPQHHASVSGQQFGEEGFDMSYTAPKPYEVQPVDPLPAHTRDLGQRTMSQIDFRPPQGHHQSPANMHHSYSAPTVPTQQGYGNDQYQHDPYGERYSQEQFEPTQESFHEPNYHVEPLRTSRNSQVHQEHVAPHDQYYASTSQADPRLIYGQSPGHVRRPSSMQPTVEDEDDVPPPPPVHRSGAATIGHPHHSPSPSYHDDAPAPLNVVRYREGSSEPPYDPNSQPYGPSDYNLVPAERRYTYPRASPQPVSRPVSRDAMAPSPLRQETSVMPTSLVAGYDSSRENRMVLRGDSRDLSGYQAPPSYETPPRQRHLSEPDYRTPPQHETPPAPYYSSYNQQLPAADQGYQFADSSPQEPRHTSPAQEPAPLIKPRAVSPADIGNGHNQHVNDYRTSRAPARSMPTRKSVSPRPPPMSGDSGERRLSGVPFNPDSFDVYNPSVSKSPKPGATESSRDDANKVEVNEKGQVVTFSGRVVDASDHLPLDSWAPEPEQKGPQKDRPSRERPQLSGARDIEAARQRERDRKERDRIRNAVTAQIGGGDSPSNSLVSTRHSYYDSPSSVSGAMVLAESTTTPPGSGGRNRLQKRNQRPVSSFMAPSQSSPSTIPMPNTQTIRDRESVTLYGGSPGYGSNRHTVAAPPIPAKIPLDTSQGEDMAALSLELQSIDIGPGSGGRNRGTARRRNYGF